MTINSGRRATGGFLREFQEFALKGNVVDLAVAVIIGGAFGKIVTSFVADLVMPLVNPLIPGGDWRAIVVGPGLKVGSFLGAVVDFLIVALVLFMVIRSLQTVKDRMSARESLAAQLDAEAASPGPDPVAVQQELTGAIENLTRAITAQNQQN
jgi:large conductance mechanosensitive channel